MILLIREKSSLKISQGNLPHFLDELLLQKFPVVDLRLMQVEQKQKEYCDHVALHSQVLNVLHIEKYVTVDLRKTKEHTQDLEIRVILYKLVSRDPASLALFKTVIVILEVAHDLGDLSTLNTDTVINLLVYS